MNSDGGSLQLTPMFANDKKYPPSLINHSKRMGWAQSRRRSMIHRGYLFERRSCRMLKRLIKWLSSRCRAWQGEATPNPYALFGQANKSGRNAAFKKLKCDLTERRIDSDSESMMSSIYAFDMHGSTDKSDQFLLLSLTQADWERVIAEVAADETSNSKSTCEGR
ncbi:hypothetical protein Aperf_G00000008699 [Anoplocephala perfoliata]